MKIPVALLLVSLFLASHARAIERGYQTVPEAMLKGKVRTNLDSPTPTKEQLARKEKYTTLVAALGGPTNKSLPVIEDDRAVHIRSVDEISKRAVAVAIAAVKGEGMPHADVGSLVKRWQVEDLFTPQEKVFINNASPSDADRAKFTWRYEDLEVLLWALGYKDNLPAPSVICEVPAATKMVIENRVTGLAKNAKPRSTKEILDIADYYYRLNWAAIELRLKGGKNAAINEEIIVERHYALNWLIRYMNQDWDNVSTDT